MAERLSSTLREKYVKNLKGIDTPNIGQPIRPEASKALGKSAGIQHCLYELLNGSSNTMKLALLVVRLPRMRASMKQPNIIRDWIAIYCNSDWLARRLSLRNCRPVAWTK